MRMLLLSLVLAMPALASPAPKGPPKSMAPFVGLWQVKWSGLKNVRPLQMSLEFKANGRFEQRIWGINDLVFVRTGTYKVDCDKIVLIRDDDPDEVYETLIVQSITPDELWTENSRGLKDLFGRKKGNP